MTVSPPAIVAAVHLVVVVILAIGITALFITVTLYSYSHTYSYRYCLRYSCCNSTEHYLIARSTATAVAAVKLLEVVAIIVINTSYQ